MNSKQLSNFLAKEQISHQELHEMLANAALESQRPMTQAGARSAIIIGVNLSEDLKALCETTNFDFMKSSLNIEGVFDVSRFFRESTPLRSPSLGSLMTERYNFESLVYKVPAAKKNKPRLTWRWSYNAGNDAMASLKASIAVILDASLLGPTAANAAYKLAHTPNFKSSESILLALHHQGHDHYPDSSVVTEWGLALLDLRRVLGVPPGLNGRNWHPYMRAVHFRNEAHKGHRNVRYVVGCPDDFQHGISTFADFNNLRPHFQHLFDALSQQPAANAAGPQFPPPASGSGGIPVYDHNNKVVKNVKAKITKDSDSDSDV